MSEATVRCPACGHEGIVITELLNSDLLLVSDFQQAEIERLREELATTRADLRIATDTAVEGDYVGLIQQRDEIERLREAIAKHRRDVWGDGEVDHGADADLYAAMEREVGDET